MEPEVPVPDVVSNDQSSLYKTWLSLCDHIQDMSNPWSKENGEPLFEELLQNHENLFNVNKVNPWHPRYGYYKSSISDLQAWDKYMDSVISDPEDDTSEDDRPVGGKRKSSWKKPCVHGSYMSQNPMPMKTMAIIGMSLTYKALLTLIKSSCQHRC